MSISMLKEYQTVGLRIVNIYISDDVPESLSETSYMIVDTDRGSDRFTVESPNGAYYAEFYDAEGECWKLVRD